MLRDDGQACTGLAILDSLLDLPPKRCVHPVPAAKRADNEIAGGPRYTALADRLELDDRSFARCPGAVCELAREYEDGIRPNKLRGWSIDREVGCCVLTSNDA